MLIFVDKISIRPLVHYFEQSSSLVALIVFLLFSQFAEFDRMRITLNHLALNISGSGMVENYGKLVVYNVGWVYYAFPKADSG